MPTPQALAPLASLAAHWQACTGDVPPALVGASATLIDDPQNASNTRLYLFGGRLVTTRRMVNDMYELDMSTLKWTRLFSEQHASSSSSPRPQPRYFHSCNLWNGKLIIFGGMGYVEGGSESDLCVLNETVAFDLHTRTWELDFVVGSEAQFQDGENGAGSPDPQPRYAHLASTSGDSLVVVGGQDLGNSYVEEINILDLKRRQWTARLPFDKQRGSYRSLAVEPQWNIAHSRAEIPNTPGVGKHGRTASIASQKQPTNSLLGPESLSFLPTSTRQYTDQGEFKALPIYVYTNYNFTDVKREMEVMNVTQDGDSSEDQPSVRIDDRSGDMTGISLPPGLRFPMGAILGSHLLISGTYLANTSQTFAVWALHLPSMAWTRLDVGNLLSAGSWNRGVLWPSQNRLAIFGHRDRDLVADYNHRQTNWDHVLSIELDAWGICQPPIFHPNQAAVELGLEKLASSAVGSFRDSLGQDSSDSINGKAELPTFALGGRGDFEILCSDGMTLGCDRAILESRWPWFAKQLRNYRLRLRTAAKGMTRQRSNDVLASLPEETENGASSIADGRLKPASLGSSNPRITPRQLIATEPSPVMLAILTYLYTGCICTRLQRHPAIIAALLVASRMYDMDDLARWAQYAAHVALSTTLAPLMPGFVEPASSDGSSSVASQDPPLPPLERHRLAVAIYEAATLSGFEALQIRALRSVMAIAKWVQRISTSSRSSSIAGLTDGTSSDKDRILERRRQASLGLYPTQTRSTASPQGSRRSSMSTSDGQPSSGFPRRDSRSERLAQLRDAEESNGARDGLSAANNFYTPSSSMPSSLSSTRRPSAVSLQSSARGNGGVASVNGMTLPLSPIKAHSSATGPPSAMPPPSASGRKRFSIFGRSSEASKLMSTGNPLDHTDDDASSSTGPSAWGGKNRMQRVNTDGGHADGMLSTSRSNSSLTSAQGSSTPTAATNEATGVNGLEGYHFGGPNGSAIGIAPRDSSRMREGSFSSATGSTANAARRVTAATLGRLKSATLSGSQSASASPSYALDGASSAEALQPSRPAPTHVPQSARSSVATSATLTGASSHTATPPASSAGHRPRGNNNANGNKKASLPTGSLSDKDIKALQSIWA